MNFATGTIGTDVLERNRARLATALVLSLLIHAFLLSLQFGVRGLGLPGLHLPWDERRARTPGLTVMLKKDDSQSTSREDAQASAQEHDARQVEKAPSVTRPARVSRHRSTVRNQTRPVTQREKRTGTKLAQGPVTTRSATTDKRRSAALAAPAEVAEVRPVVTPKQQAVEQEAQRQAEEVARLAAQMEEEARQAQQLLVQQQELARQQAAELEAQRLAEETARQAARQEEEERQAQQLLAQQQELARQQAAELEAQRLAEETARQAALREEEARQAQQLLAQQQEEFARQQAAELEARRQAEEAARQAALKEEEERQAQQLLAQQRQEELARQQAAELEAQRQAEEAERQREADEQLRQAQQLEEENAGPASLDMEARHEEAFAQPSTRESQQPMEEAGLQHPGVLPPQAGEGGSGSGTPAPDTQQAATSLADAQQAATSLADAQPVQETMPARQQPVASQPQESSGNSEDEDGPIVLTDDQMAFMRADQVRKIDLTRADAPLVEQIAGDTRDTRRRSVFGSADDDIVLKMYTEDWRQSAEERGNQLYDGVLRDTLGGDALITVSIRSDGSIEDIQIHRTGSAAGTEEALRQIVQQDGRYRAFPPDLMRRYDVIEIRRIWIFGDSLRIVEEAR